MSQKYTQITPFIHLLTNDQPRAKTELEIVMTSGGSFFESDRNSGKKHLMEHCIASRTKDMDYKTFKDFQFANSIAINAYTGPLPLAVNATTHSSKFETAFDSLAEMIFEPTFDQAILDQEKEIVLREISERRGSPEYQLYYWTMNQLFPKGSLETHETLGNAAMVAETSVQDFLDLHQQNLANSHLIINLSGGSVEENYVKSVVNKYLSQSTNNIKNILDQGQKNQVNYRPKSDLAKFEYLPLVHELAHEQSEITIYIPCEVNFANLPATKIFKELFLSFYGVIYSRLRDELGYVYGIYGNFRNDLQTLEIGMSCEIKYIAPIVSEIKQMLGNWNKYFDPKKFDELKAVLTMKIDMAADEPSQANSHTEKILRTYNQIEIHSEFGQRLSSVQPSDVQKLYENLMNNLDKIQVLAVSKDKAVEGVKI
jgi:predicted Zn-dependent peptidase